MALKTTRNAQTRYRGAYADSDGRALVYVDDRLLDPELSQKIRNHSPTGFAWGYRGSGPAQLALAILLDYYGSSRHEFWQHYQLFKEEVIARLDQHQPWSFTGKGIEAAMTRVLEIHKAA